MKVITAEVGSWFQIFLAGKGADLPIEFAVLQPTLVTANLRILV